MKAQTVLVVHSERMLGEALATALAGFPQLVPLAVATTLRDVRSLCERANVAVVDARFPEASLVASELRQRGLRVVVVGRPDDDATSWVPTDAPVSRLAWSLAPRPTVGSARHGPLTRRERQVLELVARGLAAKQVARHLGISPKTVERHKTRIFAKLGVTNQTAAVSRLLGGLSSDAVPAPAVALDGI